MNCKRHLGEASVYTHQGRVPAEAVLHPRGCMNAKSTHIDVLLPMDPCGLREALGGNCLRGESSGGYLVIDLSPRLGYPCTLEVPNPLGWSRVYMMASRSGSIYVGEC